jgi:hypothetical protein
MLTQMHSVKLRWRRLSLSVVRMFPVLLILRRLIIDSVTYDGYLSISWECISRITIILQKSSRSFTIEEI